MTKPIERPRMPISVFIRIFLVGSVAIGACVYALWRHVAIPRPSMVAPAEPVATDLLPAPELVPDETDRDH